MSSCIILHDTFPLISGEIVIRFDQLSVGQAPFASIAPCLGGYALCVLPISACYGCWH